MMFKNPILPVAAILIWEGINSYLPVILKQFSVIYYLKSLCPVDIPVPPGTPPFLALLISNSEPVSAPLAVIGLIVVASIALFVSSIQMLSTDINDRTEWPVPRSTFAHFLRPSSFASALHSVVERGGE